MEELFRWLIDVSVIHAFESDALQLSDFYFTGDDYRYRFEVEAKQHFIDLIRDRFNDGVAYRGRVLRDTIIDQKAHELGRFLTGKSSALNFVESATTLESIDDGELRERILALTMPQAKRLGIGKSTLQYLRGKAKSGQPFQVYRRIGRKLGTDSPLVPS